MSIKTSLYNLHHEQGAKWVDFAGYQLPIWYKSAKDEHLAVRQSAGMFDISHMGLVTFEGDDAGDFLQKICTNNIAATQPNKIIYTMILNHDGGILDDVMVGFNPSMGHYFMIVNASNKHKLMDWFLKNQHGSVTITPQFDDRGLVAIQGPHAMDRIRDAWPVDWASLGRFQSQVVTLYGHEALVMRTGYTGEDGIEISIHHEALPLVWSTCLSLGIVPCGLAARDSLRIESGLPLYGHELSEDISPLSTRYQWVLKWDTGFIGADSLRHQSVDQQTVGLVFADRCLPRQGCDIQEGGVITSGTFSPILNQPIAMAMVPLSIQVGQTVQVNIRDRWLTATVVSLPFNG